MTTSNKGQPPSIPADKPSRGDDRSNKEDEKSSSSRTRKSKSRRSSASSSHRRSSSSKEGSRRTYHSSHPRQSSHSPRQSSHSRSSKKTPDSKTNRERLRLAESDESDILSPPLLTSPGATSVSSSKHRRSGKRNSSRSPNGANQTPVSKHSKSNKLELIDTDGTRISTPPLDSPPGVVSESGSTRRRSRKSSKFNIRRSTAPGSKPSRRNVRLAEVDGTEIPSPPLLQHAESSPDNTPTLEASAVPPAAPEDQPSVVVATPAPKEESSRKYKYMFGAFVVFGIAAGVITWLLVPGEPQDLFVTLTFDPPTEEDCLAISEGMETADQNGTTEKLFGVEMDFAVPSTTNLELLLQELEIRIQRDVLPLLPGCSVTGPVTIENNIFIVENAVLSLVSVGDPSACTTQLSEELCSSIYLELDLFSKDDDVQATVLLDLIGDVFQDEGLLALLNLASPVKDIYFVRAFEILPSGAPSSSPSVQVGNGSPSQEICDAIANGALVPGQEALVVVVQTYDILMDVTLDSETEEISPLTMELEERIQSILMPMLAGCTEDGKSKESEKGIVNALVNVDVSVGDDCLPDSESPCHRHVAHVDNYVQRNASSIDFSEDILEIFREEPLVDRFGLQSPFKNITIVEVVSGIGSASPSGKSNDQTKVCASFDCPLSDFLPSEANPSKAPPIDLFSVNPTRAPVTFPTTDDPTRMPTRAPSRFPVAFLTTEDPTGAPVAIPTRDPTKSPALVPTLQPVVGPTPFPTPSPAISPTLGLSVAPSAAPSTPKPSTSPTTVPSTTPSSRPSLVPTTKPSESPSTQPSPTPCFQTSADLKTAADSWFTSRATVEAQYGLIGDWCFGPGVTSMNELFRDKGTFNEDISNWDISSVTSLNNMFNSATLFNQDLSSWDLSSVLTMESMFNTASSFNQDLSSWDLSAVTSMRSLFFRASSFNQDISSWNVASVTDMNRMFYEASDFNQDISSWNVAAVIDMNRMFRGASFFNQDLSLWNVAAVTDMNAMFYDASSFNQDLSSWEVSAVTTMFQMFYGASSFNQDLSSWDVSAVTSIMNMFQDASSFNQDLCAWGSRLDTFANTADSFLNANNCPTTSDPNLFYGTPPGPFCHVCYSCFGTSTDLQNAVASWFTAGRVLVEAEYGLIEDWCFGPGVTSMANLFDSQTTFNEDISNWDVSGVTDMSYMFYYAQSFNQDLSSWDVSSVVDMGRMFLAADAFNSDISSWDLSSVTTTRSMFYWCDLFNQDLSSWDVSSVTEMTYMFHGALSFNQDLSSWNVGSVTDTYYMFRDASSFNQNLCAWGTRLPSNAYVGNMFTDSLCPTPTDPNLLSNPPGPFCYNCV